jgi:hypothetical protein
MQTTIVLIIVGLAAAFLLRKVYLRLFKRTPPACGCGCNGCALQQECTAPHKDSLT